MKTFYVYTHHRADSGEVFYVGCATKHGNGRRKSYQRAYDFRQRTPEWFKIVGEAGGVNVVFVLETENHEKAWATERALIAQYGRADRMLGFLVNQTDGGSGAGGQIGTAESRQKKAVSKLGKLNPMFGRTGDRHPQSRRVVDTATGTEYPSVTAAAKANGIIMQVLHNQLTGHRKNSTALRFA